MNLYPNKHPDPEVDIGAITLCLPETKERENTILKSLIHSYSFGLCIKHHVHKRKNVRATF